VFAAGHRYLDIATVEAKDAKGFADCVDDAMQGKDRAKGFGGEVVYFEVDIGSKGVDAAKRVADKAAREVSASASVGYIAGEDVGEREGFVISEHQLRPPVE
jgi:hypothetical protein